jgi:hypothetical protein
LKSQRKLLYTGIFISIILSWVIFFIFSDKVLNNLTSEDHFIEWIGTTCLLASSIAFFISYLRNKEGNDLILFKTDRNYFFLLLALIFFFGFGEEISWGQRIFGWHSPGLFNHLNDQQETNIHNLKLFRGVLGFNHLFTFFWVSYCLIVPLLIRKSAVVSNFLTRINLPIVPLWLGISFLFSYTFFIVLKMIMLNLTHALTEVKETSLSSLFLVFSILCLNKVISQDGEIRQW